MKAARFLIISFSFCFLQACSEAIPESTDLSSSFDGGLVATVSGLPSGTSGSVMLSAIVSGLDVVEYAYKVGSSGTTDCSLATGYSSMSAGSGIPIAVPITDFIGSFADGSMKLCVVGGDGTDWQDISVATVYTWSKDTQLPSLTISSAQSSPTNASPIPVTFTFDEAVTGFSLADVTISNASITNFVAVDGLTFTADLIPTVDGTVSVSVAASLAQDAAGNSNTASNSLSWSYDGTAPQLLMVSIPSADGVYTAGTVFPIRLTYDEAVLISGAIPYVQVEAGATDRTAQYLSGSGTSTITFSYTVTASDVNNDLDLVAGSQLFTNGAVVADALGNVVSTALPIGAATTGSISNTQNIKVVGTPALLTLSDGPLYDYGAVPNGGSLDYTLTVTNTGGYPASSFSEVGLAAPFAFKGGSYPGGSGTCGATLAAGASCTLEISFSPMSVAVYTDTVNLQYDDGLTTTSVTRDLTGTGVPPALLSISDGPSYNFGQLGVGDVQSYAFTLTNSGAVTATGITGAGLAAQFSYLGGAFPGGGTCTSNLAAGSSCTFVVAFTPDAIGSFSDSVLIDYNDGVMGGVTVSRNVLGDGIFEVVPVYGLNNGDVNTNWNDYIKFDNDAGGTSPYDQDVEVCDGTETGYYGELGGCIHSGEKRKVVYYGQGTCANITAVDYLGVFDWICRVESGDATLHIKGFAAGKGLRDLIDGAGFWKSNYVEIYDGAALIGSTAYTSWWTNPLQDLAIGGFDNSAVTTVVSLNTASTIYYINADRPTFGYQMGADKISIVTLGTSVFKKYALSPTNNCGTTTGTVASANFISMLCGGSRKFVWVEADIDAFTDATNMAYNGLYAFNFKSSRIHHTSVLKTHANNMYYGVSVNGPLSSSNLISNLTVNSSASGLELKDSQKSTYAHISIANIGIGSSAVAKGLSLTSFATHNRFYDLRIANMDNSHSSTVGLSVGSSNNIFQRLNINNVRGKGLAVYMTAAASNNVFTQVITSQTSDAGFGLYGASNNVFGFTTHLNNDFNGIYFDSALSVNNNLFLSTVVASVGNKGIEAAGSGSSNLFVDTYLANNGSFGASITQSGFANSAGYLIAGNNGGSDCAAGGSNLCVGPVIYSSGGNLASSFSGAVSSDDVANPADFSGAISTAPAAAEGWTNFDNWARALTQNGFSFPSPSMRGFSTTNFLIWDSRPLSGDNLYDRSYSGTSVNGTLNIDGSPCVANTVASTDYLTSALGTFLRTAIEIAHDQVGNNNGLCEANEDCIFAPHIGAYQGDGGLLSGYCTIGDGAGSGLDGIKIYRHVNL